MKKLVILLFAVFLIIQPAFSANFQQFSHKRYIDLDSIKRSNYSGYYIPEEYFYVMAYYNDGSSFFSDLEEKTNKEIDHVLMAKVINCKQKKIILLGMDIFDSQTKTVISNISFPYSPSRFKKIEPNSLDEIEYEEICKENKDINYRKANKTGNKSVEKKLNKTKQITIMRTLNYAIQKAISKVTIHA